MVSEQSNGESEGFYENEIHLRKLCNFLRSPEGPSVREAIEMDKRVYYLKGKRNILKRENEWFYTDSTMLHFAMFYVNLFIIRDVYG